MTTDTGTVPVPPTPPKQWNWQTIITYGAGLVTFTLGVLVLLGVAVPDNVSQAIQIILGAILSVAGTFTVATPHLVKASVTKKAVAAGYSPEEIKAIL
jgi:hypothetical protein